MKENKRQPLDEYEAELLREVVGEDLIDKGFGDEGDNHEKLIKIISESSKEVVDLLKVSYLMGYNDGLSRYIYGGGAYEVNNRFAREIRGGIESKFKRHRKDGMLSKIRRIK